MTKELFIPVNGVDRLSAIYHKPEEKATNVVERVESGEGDTEGALPTRSTLVVMVHGFPGGHKGTQNDIYGDLEYHLGTDGFPAVRFDFRGCGESEGKSEDFTLETASEDLDAVFAWGKEQGFEKFIYIGEGLGAALALLHARKIDDNRVVRAVVLLWPAFDLRLTPAGELPPPLDEEILEVNDIKVGRIFVDQVRNFDPEPLLKDLEIPLLIQHGRKDDVIPITQVELLRRYADSSRRIELTTYEDGQHGLRQLNERNTLFHHVRQFVNRYA